MPGVHDLNRYTMAWAAAYLTGDRDEALARLWAVHRAWQGLN
jgi:predicted metallopeptidase